MKKEFHLSGRLRSIIIAIFAFAIFSVSYGQLPEGIRKERHIKQALCHIWNVNYEVGFTTALEEPTESFPTIDFLDNGVLMLNTTSSKVASWRYDKKSDLLILDLRGQSESYKILKLTNKELVLQGTDSGERQRRYWRND
jgi:hypothetical protein